MFFLFSLTNEITSVHITLLFDFQLTIYWAFSLSASIYHILFNGSIVFHCVDVVPINNLFELFLLQWIDNKHLGAHVLVDDIVFLLYKFLVVKLLGHRCQHLKNWIYMLNCFPKQLYQSIFLTIVNESDYFPRKLCFESCYFLVVWLWTNNLLEFPCLLYRIRLITPSLQNFED